MWQDHMVQDIIDYVPFSTDHLERASKVYTACFNGPPWHDNWSQETARVRLQILLDYPNAIGFVAIRNEELVGLVMGNCEPWSDGISYYLNELCVSLNEQRSGIGESLLDNLLKELKNREVESVYLLTEHSSGAESFFLNQGFEADPSTVKLWRNT
jgi:ribosomal protein S18 acetylase RimI-like enzyme